MPRYRTRSVEVDAVRWVPPGHPGHDPEVHRSVRPGPPGSSSYHLRPLGTVYRIFDEPVTYALITPDGEIHLENGDYITGSGSTARVAKRAQFEAFYEPVPDLTEPSHVEAK